MGERATGPRDQGVVCMLSIANWTEMNDPIAEAKVRIGSRKGYKANREKSTLIGGPGSGWRVWPARINRAPAGIAAAHVTATYGACAASVWSNQRCCLTSDVELSSQTFRQGALDVPEPAWCISMEAACAPDIPLCTLPAR